eukprot:TRINITY_DN2642_c0_g1_i5.p1 TRINITY_DN2642_c0_g1~~TRINITY_DN2642_c0_g1_i5.p1  ORF type:complete len:1924 (-),score=530.94 TRINITY_DN2642_c0_g1_i5:358-6129(-)
MSTCTWKSGGFLSIPSVKPPFHSGALFKDPSGGEQPVVLLHSVGRLWWNLPRKIPKEVLNLTRELFSIQRAKNEPLCFGILKTGQLFLWNVLGNEPLRWASDGLFVSPRPRKKRVGCGRPQPSEESILAVHISPDGDLVVVIDRGYVVNMYSVKRDKWICLGTVGPRGVSAVDIVFHDTPELGSVMTVCVAHSRSTLGSKLVHDEIVLDRFSDKGSSTSHTSDLLVLCTVVPSTVWEELLLAEHQSIPSGAGHSSTGVDVGTVQEMIEVPIDLFQTENASKFRICNMIPADIMATRILSMKNEASFPVIVRVSPDAKSIAVYVNDSSTSDRGVLIFLFSETRRYWEVSSGRVAGENTPSNVRMDYGPMANHVDDVRWFASPHSDGPDRFISLFSRTGTVGVSLSCYGHIFVDQDYFSNILVLDKAVFSSRIFLLDGPGDDDMFLSMSNGQERVIYGSWEVPTMKNVFRDVDLDHAWLLAFCLDKWNDPADIVVERTCKEIDNIMARVGVGDMTIGSCGKRVLEMLLHLFRHSSWDRHEHKCPPVKNPGTLFVVMHAWEKFARILEEESFVVQFYLIATCIHRFGFAIEWIRDVILGTTKNMSSSSYNLSPRVMGMMNILSSMLQTNSFSLMRFKERRKDVYLKPVLEGHHLALRGNFKEANERYRSCILSARVPPPFLRDGKSLRSTPSREEALCALWISSILGSGVHHSQDSSMVCRVDMKNVLDALNIVGDFISVHFGRFLHVEGMKESNTRRMSVLDLLTKSPTYSSAERLVLRSSVFLLLWGLASADESVGLSCTGSLCPPSLSREAMAWISLVDTDVSRMLVDSEGEGRQKSGEWIRLVHNENLRGTTEGDIFAAARSIDTLLLLHEYALAVELSLALHWSEEFLRLAEFANMSKIVGIQKMARDALLRATEKILDQGEKRDVIDINQVLRFGFLAGACDWKDIEMDIKCSAFDRICSFLPEEAKKSPSILSLSGSPQAEKGSGDEVFMDGQSPSFSSFDDMISDFGLDSNGFSPDFLANICARPFDNGLSMDIPLRSCPTSWTIRRNRFRVGFIIMLPYLTEEDKDGEGCAEARFFTRNLWAWFLRGRLSDLAHQLTSRRVESVDEERIDTRGNLLEAALWMAEFVGMDEIVPKAHVQAAVLSLLLSDACEDKEKVASIFFKAHLHLRVARNVQGLLNRFIDRIHSRDDDLVRMLEDEEKMPIDPESWAMGQENAEDGIFSVYGSQTIRWIHEKSEFFLQFQDELRRFCSSSPLLQIASIVRLRAKERAQSLPGGLPGWFGDVISSVGDVDFVDEREFVDGTPSSPDGSQSDASVERQQPLQSDDVGFSHEMQECPVQIQLESISVEHAEKSARLEEEKDLERQSRHEDQTVVETAQKSLPGEWETREEEQNGVGTTEPLLRKSSEQPQHVSLSLKRVVETKVQKRSHALTDDASSGLSVGEDRDFDQDDIFPTMDEDQEVLVTQIEIADEMVKKSASASASAMREERGGTASESREGVILSKPRAKTRSEERMRSRYDDSGPRKTNVTLLSFPRSKGDQRHPIAKHVHHKPLIQLYSSPKKPEHPKQSGNESLRLMRVHGHPDATTHGKTSTGHPAFFGGPTRKRIHLLRVTKQEDRGRSLAVRPDHVKRVAVAKPIISPKSSSPVSPMSPIPHDASTLSKKTRMLVLPRQEPIRHADANVMTSTPEKQHAWSVHTQTDETERRGHSMPPRAMDPISPTHSEPKSIEFRSSFSARRSEEEWVRSVDEVVPASVISLSENAHSVGLGGDQSPPVSCEDIGIQVGSTAEDSHGEYPLAEDDDEQFVEPPLVFDLLAQPPKKTYLHIADIGELAFAKEPGSEGSGLTKRLAEVEKMVVEVQSDLSTHRHALNALEKEVDDETDERMRELPHAHVTLPPPRPPRRYSIGQPTNPSIRLRE